MISWIGHQKKKKNHHQQQATQEKHTEPHKTKSLLHSKGKNSIFVNHVPDKGLTSKIEKRSLQLNSKNKQPDFKMGKKPQ